LWVEHGLKFVTRFATKRNVILIKKVGNQLVRRTSQELSERLSGATSADDQRKSQITMKRQRIEILKQALRRIKTQNKEGPLFGFDFALAKANLIDWFVLGMI